MSVNAYLPDGVQVLSQDNDRVVDRAILQHDPNPPVVASSEAPCIPAVAIVLAVLAQRNATTDRVRESARGIAGDGIAALGYEPYRRGCKSHDVSILISDLELHRDGCTAPEDADGTV